MNITCRVATLDEIIDLRELVIVRGTGRSTEFPGDRESSSLHFGAFIGKRTVGCASFILNPWRDAPAYQLRGMATAPDARGRGIGRALLSVAERHIVTHSQIRQLWCNARASAISFYEAVGWQAVSAEFEVEGVGPHRKMCKRLAGIA